MMVNYVVEIGDDEGPIYTSMVSRKFKGKSTKPFLRSISGFSRAVNLNRSIESSRVTIEFWKIPENIEEKIFRNEILIGRKVVVYDSGEGDDSIVFSGHISSVPAAELWRLQVTATNFYAWDSPVNKKMLAAEFLTIPAENDGAWGNIIAGTADDSNWKNKGLLTARKFAEDKFFHAAWHFLNQLISVFDESGNDITSSCTLVNHEPTGYARILYTNAAKKIYFNCLGMDNISFIDNPARQLQEIVNRFSADIQLDSDSVDETAATFDTMGYSSTSGNICVHDGIYWTELFRKFCESYCCYIFPARNGDAVMKAFQFGNDTEVYTIPPSMLKNYTPRRDENDLTQYWTRKYRYHFRDREFQFQPQDVSAMNPSAKENILEQRYVSDDTVSLHVAQRTAQIFEKPRLVYAFEVPRIVAKNFDIGQTVLLHNPRSKRNTYQGWRKVLVLQENRSPGNAFVRFLGLDTTNIV